MIGDCAPGLPRYDDPPLRLNMTAPAGENGPHRYQVFPVPESLREMAAPMVLPPVISAGFIQDPDGAWYPFECTADLDPAVNRGCTSAWISFLDPPGAWVRSRPLERITRPSARQEDNERGS